MPDRIRVKLTPQIIHLTPSASGDGQFASAATPGKKSFPVLIGVQVSLEDRGSGTMPPELLSNAKPAARLEILARQRDTANPAAPYTLCGTFNGTMSLTGPGRTPTLVAKRSNANGTISSDFTSAKLATPASSIPDTISRSDWTLPLKVDQATVQIANDDKLTLPIPWIFNPTDPHLQLNARLSIAGVLETDVVGQAGNMPIDVPLQHDSVPDEAIAGNAAKHPLLTFFGLHTLSTMTREGTFPPGLSSRGLTVNVFVDDTVLSLVPFTNVGQFRDHISAVLRAAGFQSVNVELAGATPPTPPGQTAPQTVRARFAALFVQGRSGQTQSLWFMSRNVPVDKRDRFATAMEAHQRLTVLQGETVDIPFFDFYVCAQNVDPQGKEVGHSENIISIVGAKPSATPPIAAKKILLAPIVITAGSDRQTGIRKLLNGMAGGHAAQLVASTVVHEIGHTLGLRHVVSFQETLPYVFADAQCRSVMGAAVAPTDPVSTPPAPFEFFSPVQTETIRQHYL